MKSIFAKWINRIPRDWLVWMYRHMPLNRFKNWAVRRSQHHFLVAVLGVFTNEKGEVLLLRHSYREQEPWGIPGGWMELEQPEHGLKREIREETGLEVHIDRLEKAIQRSDPNCVDLIFSGEVRAGTFVASSEITDIMYCRAGDWPKGLPRSQQLIIQGILDRRLLRAQTAKEMEKI
ncbi:NUDIX hydrolase [Paenibacillus bovis]|uniref:NUDIX hydrolase n=1 Tax=Paenibacillus bovis TaxID=1616788 RepID=UPI000AE6AAF9|nr:NUDIX hydrolase [Paenibacillus bovis]